MGIIDEKGRLFGKLNIIDFLVILFLFCLTPMFYFGYKLFVKSPLREPTELAKKISATEMKGESIETEFDYLFIKLKPEVAKMITLGDKEMDEKGEVIAEILDIGEVSPYIHRLNIGFTEKLVRKNKFLKQIPVALRMKVELKQGNLYYKGEPILKDSAIYFKTDKYTVEGKFLFKPAIQEEVDKLQEEVDKLQEEVDKLQEEVDKILLSPKIQRLIKK